MENGLYTAHEVAVIIADLFGDDCACNFNGIDEWLPFKCELLDACPNTCGVACWEQYLKYRHCKNEKEANMYIKEIGKDFAIRFVQTYHYSQIMPRMTKYWLGLFNGDVLCGVVTLGWGTQPLQTIKKLFPGQDFITSDYLEIGKMCFLPQFNNSNFGSMALSLLVKWCKKSTNIRFLYTLADGIMGKCGYVYQASNFRYIGSFKTSVYMDTKTGEKIHPRSAKALCVENAEWEGKKKVFWLTDDFCKYKGIDKINGLMFRYIYPMDRNAKRILEKTYPKIKNPKDEDLLFERRVKNGVFERIQQPNFNMRVFNHNFQKGMEAKKE